MNALICLAAGAFAVGTEGFVIAPLLPTIAQDLDISVATAGYAVTSFAIAYAVGSPLLAALTGSIDRRRLLITALGGFAVANLAAALSQSFVQLVIARVMLALAAGLYMPVANAAAVQLATQQQRGRAVAAVTGGVTVAVAFGAPLGAWFGHLVDWRATFILIGAATALSTLALCLRLPTLSDGPKTTLGERLDAIRRPDILVLLVTTITWSAGGFAVYTFIAPYLGSLAGFSVHMVDATVFVFGVCAAAGIAAGGWATDRFGADATLRAALGGMLAALVALASLGEWGNPVMAGAPTVMCMAAWGISGWAFNPAQALRLIERAPRLIPVTLSLNASALHLGAGIGAFAGSLLVANAPIRHLAWLGVSGLVLAVISTIRRRRSPQDVHVAA